MVLDIDEIKHAILNNRKIFDTKYTLSTFADPEFSLDREIVKKLSGILWHNLDKVKEIFKHSANIELPEIDNYLRRAILTRHDIVHRNGKKIDGEETLITHSDVKKLISEVELFAYSINNQVLELRKKHRNT